MIAAVPHHDAIIPTTRVQLAIVDSETPYITSMSLILTLLIMLLWDT
jgi:hypothetical protein